jgi:hypothetical protein
VLFSPSKTTRKSVSKCGKNQFETEKWAFVYYYSRHVLGSVISYTFREREGEREREREREKERQRNRETERQRETTSKRMSSSCKIVIDLCDSDSSDGGNTLREDAVDAYSVWHDSDEEVGQLLSCKIERNDGDIPAEEVEYEESEIIEEQKEKRQRNTVEDEGEEEEGSRRYRRNDGKSKTAEKGKKVGSPSHNSNRSVEGGYR